MREFLMLAKEYANQDITGWFYSEKMDGFRAFWDGGISRGCKVTDVPWANLKGHLSPDKVINIDATGLKATGLKATGLWSRYGNVICAPDWWLDKLPKIPLDGELWCGRGTFQKTMSICKQQIPDDRWHEVEYHVFDSPSYDQVFTTGEINNPNFQKKISCDECLNFATLASRPGLPFISYVMWSCREANFWNDVVHNVVQQIVESNKEIPKLLKEILELGGEGLVFRHPKSMWCPNRTGFLLKLKAKKDSEGTIVGYKWGRGKHTRKMGSLIVSWENPITKIINNFDISGFTDSEREWVFLNEPYYVKDEPGELMPSDLECKEFKREDQITFSYRELTDSGIPKEARYLRKFDNENC
jgi:DNA ligase-1